MLVGLTVVASATSAPELAVAVDATLGGSPGLAIGNVVGSNIANILLVLGVSAAILPLAVDSEVVRRDIPVVTGMSLAVLAMSLDLRLSRIEGLLLLAMTIAYLTVTVRAARATPPIETDEPLERNIGRDATLIAVGVAMLVLGAKWLVSGATEVAESFGVSELIIGLTVVAVGTSLPELATSLIAAVRGERDLAVGNIVGSCVFNLGVVLGTSAVLARGGVPVDAVAVRFDLPFMLAAALALIPIAFTGMVIARWEGLLFVGYYVAYVTFLILTASEHPALGAFSTAMLLFVVPLSVTVVLGFAVAELRQRRTNA
jgi:cation:H+ antiporter